MPMNGDTHPIYDHILIMFITPVKSLVNVTYVAKDFDERNITINVVPRRGQTFEITIIFIRLVKSLFPIAASPTVNKLFFILQLASTVYKLYIYCS